MKKVVNSSQPDIDIDVRRNEYLNTIKHSTKYEGKQNKDMGQ